MNHVNWVQQSEDYKTEYHVLKWKSSHFHEPYARRNTGDMPKQPTGAAAAAAEEMKTEAEGLVLGLADKRKSGTRPGFGIGDRLGQGVAGEDRGRDGVSISAQGTRQQNAAGQTRDAVQAVGQTRDAVQVAGQTAEQLVQIQAAETVAPTTERASLSVEEKEEQANRENTTVAETGQGNIRNRLKESARRLQEAYQRQKEKAAKLLPLKQVKEEKPKEKAKGTRMADREAMLSMQAENHYLLDSYDHTGNYSMLGK